MTDKSSLPDLFAVEVFEGVGTVHIETDAFTADAIQLYEFDQDMIYEITMADPEDKAIMLRQVFEQALVDPSQIPKMSQLSAMNMNEVVTEWRNLSAELANETIRARIADRRARGLKTTTFGLID